MTAQPSSSRKQGRREAAAAAAEAAARNQLINQSNDNSNHNSAGQVPADALALPVSLSTPRFRLPSGHRPRNCHNFWTAQPSSSRKQGRGESAAAAAEAAARNQSIEAITTVSLAGRPVVASFGASTPPSPPSQRGPLDSIRFASIQTVDCL